MNPEDPNVHAWLEPELEARLVASLLGEASAFEQAELDRLIKERPEIAVFQRRLQAVHGLVGDAVKQGPDDEWKLSKEKRAKVLETLRGTADKDEKVAIAVAKEPRKAFWLGTAAVASAVLFAGAVAVTHLSGVMSSASLGSVATTRETEESLSYGFEVIPAPVTPEAPTSYQSRNAEVTLNVTAQTGVDSDMVDLDLQPEVVEFDGFANYEAKTDHLETLAEVEEESLGDLAQAEQQFYEVLRSDAYNAAARQGLERIERSRSRYKGAARDQTRAELLDKVADTWEMPIPKKSEALASAPELLTRSGREAQVEVVRELIDPDEFDAPELPQEVATADGAVAFPVTPAAPTRLARGFKWEESEPFASDRPSLAPSAEDFGTKLTQSDSATTDASLWISQPGMIRSFSESGDRSSVEKDESYAPLPDGEDGFGMIAGFSLVGRDHADADDSLGLLRSNEGFGEETSGPHQLDKFGRSSGDGESTRVNRLADIDFEGLAQLDGIKALKEVEDLSGTLDLASSVEDEPLLETPVPVALAQQSDKVEEARLRMLDLAERYRIVDLAAMQNRASHTGDPVTGTGTILMSSMQDTYTAESNIAQIKMQIEKLEGVEGEELIQSAAMLDINDASLQTLLPQYQRAILEKRKLLASGVTSNHPDVAALDGELVKTSSMLGKAAEEARSTLKTKLDMAERALALAKDIEEGKKDTSMDERRKYAEYSEASKEYELQKNMLVNMQAKHAKNQPPRLLKRVQQAKRPAPKPMPKLNEKHAKQEPFSTFSLHVSDVAFKLAKAALLEQNKWPEVEKVRVEEFVNAFDYGDPAPTQAEKVSCKVEQAAHPFRQQRNLLRVSMRTAEMGRSSGTPLQITLLLDTSGSMERADRQESISRAMEVLTSQLTPNDTATLIGFARQPRLIQDRLTGEALSNLPQFVKQTPSEGGTNLEEALLLGAEHARRQFVEAGQNRIVLLTDGAANLGDADAESLRDLVVGLRQEGIAFDACGVGAEGLNDAVLEALTRDGDGRYYLLNKPEDADAGFARQLAGAFRPAARNVKVQVRFNDRRVGHYRLLGFEKHRLKKEDFRNDKVDAAEMASSEAGVAVYEIEPLPQGDGEIGEVSVRFQDMATGRMVERTWPITHHANVPVLEEATPSLQLASTAAFLGEKLKGTLFGKAIDLGELSQVLTNLRQHYSSNQRVASLIAMIEKAKEQ